MWINILSRLEKDFENIEKINSSLINHSTSHTNQMDLKVNHKIASSTYENNYAFELLYLIHSTQKICGSDMWFHTIIIVCHEECY